MSYNPQKHHRKSIRLQGYDYSRCGLYFITVLSYKRVHIFGQIQNEDIILSDLGNITLSCWRGVPNHFKNTMLHEFVIMPNHVHGIVEILPPESNDHEDLPDSPHINQFQRCIPKSISSIVREFKSAVSRKAHTSGWHGPVWHRNYYEHIIRDSRSFGRISEYIQNNPREWEADRFYKGV